MSEQPATADAVTHHVCRGCEGWYTLTAGQLAFFAERKLKTPTHCPACRKLRRDLVTARWRESLNTGSA